MKPCQHCGKLVRLTKARKLCWYCYQIPVIREHYQGNAPENHPERDEPTEDELNATIAKQMRNLPDWWIKEKK